MKYKSFAKVNIFLKILGLRANYHLISSRFVLLKDLFDILELKEKKFSKKFEIEGDFSCEVEDNIIYKAYLELLKYTSSKSLLEFFFEHKIVVDKKIPSFAGLGGGSSNGALFLNIINKLLSLNLRQEELAFIASKVGADLAFFVYNINSANVSGIGEVVEEFQEDSLDLELISPNIKSSTKDVYEYFRKNFYKEKKYIDKYTKLSSKELLSFLDISEANDLYRPALALYPSLKEYEKDYFFSGSGSSFFRLKR